MWGGRKRGNKLLRCFMIAISDISSGNIIELSQPNNLSKATLPPHHAVGFRYIFLLLTPGLRHGALLNFCGKFLVFDVQSSTTEKEQTVSYPMFLKIGAPVHGAGTD